MLTVLPLSTCRLLPEDGLSLLFFFAPDVLGYLRLGSIAMKAGNFADSTDFFSEVLAIEKDNANAWSLMGLVHMKKSEWKPCQKKFERILTHTEYALLLSPVSLRLLSSLSAPQQARPLRSRGAR